MQQTNNFLDKILIPLGLVGKKHVTKKRKIKLSRKKTFRFKKIKKSYINKSKSYKKMKKNFRKKTYGKY